MAGGWSDPTESEVDWRMAPGSPPPNQLDGRSMTMDGRSMTRLRVCGRLAGLWCALALIAAGTALADNQQGGNNQQGENNVRCENHTFGAVTIDGNVVVPSGAFCDLNGTHITGNATVKSGPPEPSEPTSLTSNGATIDGNVS